MGLRWEGSRAFFRFSDITQDAPRKFYSGELKVSALDLANAIRNLKSLLKTGSQSYGK